MRPRRIRISSCDSWGSWLQPSSNNSHDLVNISDIDFLEADDIYFLLAIFSAVNKLSVIE
jgi:hypothetical protein